MQTVLEVEASVEPGREQACVTAHRPATLHYTIKNITAQPPQETQFGTTPLSGKTTHPSGDASPTSIAHRLGYEVCVDKKVWSLQEQGQGVVDIPEPQRSVRLAVGVVPSGNGSLPIPVLTLRWGSAGLAVGGGAALTNAQVYNAYHSQTVNVQSLTAAGR